MGSLFIVKSSQTVCIIMVGEEPNSRPLDLQSHVLMRGPVTPPHYKYVPYLCFYIFGLNRLISLNGRYATTNKQIWNMTR